MADISQIQLLDGATYNIKDTTARAAIPTVSSSDNDKILKVVNGSWAAAADDILVVNATLDMEHSESEDLIPLILSKTTAEILAAKYTVLAIEVGEGIAYYELPESMRSSSDVSGEVHWRTNMSEDTELQAYVAFDEEETNAYVQVIEEGDTEPDDTDRFIVSDSTYIIDGQREYNVTATQLTSDIYQATKATINFDFAYSPPTETLMGKVDARLAYYYDFTDGEGNHRTDHVYEAMVEKSGALWCVAVTRTEENGSTTCSVSVISYPINTFILHGTLTSQTEGTITESISDLVAAVQANKNIVLEFVMGSDNIHLVLDTNVTWVDNGSTYATAASLFYYKTGQTQYFVNVTARPNDDKSALVMQAVYLTATPAI